jgi:hypothetical protein
MKLPHAEKAFVDLAKLRDYSLSSTHPEGKHKARVFFAALGLEAKDAAWLQEQLRRGVLSAECETGLKTQFGQRYSVDLTLRHGPREAQIRSAWIIRPGEEIPRLVSCYVI